MTRRPIDEETAVGTGMERGGVGAARLLEAVAPLLDRSIDPLVALDGTGALRYTNPAFATLVGVNVHDTAAARAALWFAAGATGCAPVDLRAALPEPGAGPSACTLRHAFGVPIPVWVEAIELVDVANDLTMYRIEPAGNRRVSSALADALQRFVGELEALGLTAPPLPMVATASGDAVDGPQTTIHVLHDRRRYADELPVALAEELERLTAREHDVLRALMRGERVGAIARNLEISQHTVRNHLKAIFHKLGIQSQTELLLKVSPLLARGRTDVTAAASVAP